MIKGAWCRVRGVPRLPSADSGLALLAGCVVRVFMVLGFMCMVWAPAAGRAEEVTIFYTGDTHAMLYPCNCPIEPDGGVARRAALVKLLRSKYPHSLLLDSGGFFAGGPLDEYSQNTQLDQLRTKVQLAAMELTGYDALAIGNEELNFGDDFLRQAVSDSQIDFLSCNLEGAGSAIKPFVVKNVAGIKVGIIGVTPLSVEGRSAALSVRIPVEAVSEAVAALRKQAVDMIVLLSRLGESGDRLLLESVPGIDALIIGGERASEKPFDTAGDTLILRPSWQGRRLGEATFVFRDKKIIEYRVEEVRLSPQIEGDKEVQSSLPACFSDLNCQRYGPTAECVRGGASDAVCDLPEAQEVAVQVITSKECATCHPEFILSDLKKHFPRLSVTYIEYPGKRAQELIDLIKPQALPVYLFGEEIQKERNFHLLSGNFYKKGSYYMLKSEASGISYLFDRTRRAGRFDLFLRLYDTRNEQLLENCKALNPVIHFLVYRDEDGLQAPGGLTEVEDTLRAVCIQKYFPEQLPVYIACRSQEKQSSWWQRCIGQADAHTVSVCAQGEEGRRLLEENIALTNELMIRTAPTYLLNNRQIFSSEIVPQEADLREVIDQTNKEVKQ